LQLFPHEKSLTIDCTFNPVPSADGQRLLLEILSVEQVLRIAREEGLIAQQHAMKLLVRGLAHEIKNPLGGLRGAAQLLEREISNEQKEFTQIIIGEADRLQKLVDDMLGPNKMLHREPVNIHQLISVSSADTLHIKRDYDPSIPEVSADRNQLVQVLLNIVRNAKEALDDQGTIRLCTRAQSHSTIGQRSHKLVLRIDVIDDGPGISADMIDQIFYPMVTGKSNGTGLGLSIAQTIIGQHGGLVECQSEPGRTVFSVLLPIGSDS
jgi:two-component system nitrogen regulation sensor histidine kinase GlnL